MIFQLIILVASILVSHGELDDLPRQYVVRRDFFNFMKSSEFSVYDIHEKVQHYRIQSEGYPLQKIKIIRYPDSTTVAKLSSKRKYVTYKGTFSILNEADYEWITGTITQDSKYDSDRYQINWNGTTITMDRKPDRAAHEFRDSDGELLAHFRVRLATSWWTPKYDVKVYSNDFPDQIYFLAVAAFDYRAPRRGKR